MTNVISLDEVRRRSRPDPLAEFDRVMGRLFEVIDLIDEGEGAGARKAVCDACEMLLRREERIFVWPRK